MGFNAERESANGRIDVPPGKNENLAGVWYVRNRKKVKVGLIQVVVGKTSRPDLVWGGMEVTTKETPVKPLFYYDVGGKCKFALGIRGNVKDWDLMRREKEGKSATKEGI